jgi:hypothetical protein
VKGKRALLSGMYSPLLALGLPFLPFALFSASASRASQGLTPVSVSISGGGVRPRG